MANIDVVMTVKLRLLVCGYNDNGKNCIWWLVIGLFISFEMVLYIQKATHQMKMVFFWFKLTPLDQTEFRHVGRKIVIEVLW